MPGEGAFIAWLRTRHRSSSEVPVPIGDDLAVLRWGATDLLLVGVDQVLDGVHFDSVQHSPREIGRKAMNRNLSDCAAMACLPAAAVASAALPKGAGLKYPQELYLGMREAADEHGCAIVGGDTASWDGKLALSVTILGRSAGIRPITRLEARPGDHLYVSGALGGSILGRHMTFKPRIALARDVARSARVSAMIDLSDGLARDLTNLCHGSGVGAELDAGSIPVHEDARRLSIRDGTSDALRHALNDGEDYELLVASPDDLRTFGFICVGRVVAGDRVTLRRGETVEPVGSGGWEHSL